MFHGEPTVGLQPDIPLSRRVQLAVLAHIRHTHTRYDQLLKETSWMNARKAVEPVCLDFIVKWRGDEETGRDQMDEILREVVIITDSEQSEESSEEDDSSDEDGEVSSSSSGSISQPASRNQTQSGLQQHQVPEPESVSRRKENVEKGITASGVVTQQNQPKANSKVQRDKRTQRGFKRYQAAWDDAVHRLHAPETALAETAFEAPTARKRDGGTVTAIRNQPVQATSRPQGATYGTTEQAQRPDLIDTRRHVSLSSSLSYPTIPWHNAFCSSTNGKQEPRYLRQRTGPGMFPDRNEVKTRCQVERPTYYQDVPLRLGTPTQQAREYRLSPMVRRPPSRGLQDVLVPSIETGSSDALIELSHPNMRRDIYDDFDQASYPRRVVERRRQTPESHQVIMISDDSPQPKRRRVVHDDSGYFRPFTSRDQMAYSTAPHAESHLIPASSTQPRDSFVQSPRNPGQLSQGLLRDTRQSLTNPFGDRIPIYDEPVESGYAAAIPPRGAEFGIGSGHQREVPSRQISPPRPSRDRAKESIYIRRPVTEDARMAGREQVVRLKEPDLDLRNQTQRALSPCFPVSSRVSRSYEMGGTSVYTGQPFMHNSSQSRLDPPPLSNQRDDINVVVERPRYNFPSQNNIPQRFEDLPVRSHTAFRHTQNRSPVQYVGRPM
jgi:hypothetical protein